MWGFEPVKKRGDACMTPIINVEHLTKEFTIKKKTSGFFNYFKTIFSKGTKFTAVKNISFNVNKGELVGLIGPNGAGKSTTIKMMTGILHPTNGTINIMGYNPVTERQILAYKIGTIFGQKPQLWYHLPAIDTYNLLKDVYNLNTTEYKKRVTHLIKEFEVEQLVNTPVRKLSLGERMRCELIGSLLHNPQLVFLDEPTIGMDIIVKKKIREMIKKMNREHQLTILLTSHDLEDIEDVCERLIIINHGTIVYDGPVKGITKKYLSTKIVTVITRDGKPLSHPKGVKVHLTEKFKTEIHVNTKKISLKKLNTHLFNKNNIEDITIEDLPIEEVIAKIYSEKR